MKLAETITTDESEGLVLLKQTHDLQPVLDEAKLLRDAGKERMGDSRLVGVIDPHQWECWAREAGIRLDDHEAMKDVVRRKLMSGEFSRLRVWNGRF